MASTQAALAQGAQTLAEQARPRPRIDATFLLGVAIAFGAVVAGVAAAGISIVYFLQPAGALIVVGGTLGVMLITTPKDSIFHALRRVMELISAEETSRPNLVEEIIFYSRVARRGGILSLEPMIAQSTHPFLRQALQLALDVGNRAELQSVLENELRMRERQGETDAKTLEVAGGFAPTIGIIGTVVGLIEVLRHFANIQSVGLGIGTAFVSTIYGLALANLLLLPAAHRIRARVAQNFEIQELIIEGVLAVADNVHPALIRLRLNAYIREPGSPGRVTATSPSTDLRPDPRHVA
ncbi:MAG TPA: MotA/TolQ/ExbB proton channel family protein [Bryobacteraceae bacterium]|nr:MotA/TolQ/ExbB proton channel family protein [Bryobacteraceae bacterium]